VRVAVRVVTAPVCGDCRRAVSSSLEEDQAQEVLMRGGEMCKLPSCADISSDEAAR
jgi:hypothetical protein